MPIDICFGHRTALEILRVANREELRKAGRRLPARAPGACELPAVLKRLESTYPALRLQEPVHVLVDGSKGFRTTARCKPHMLSGDLPGGALLMLDDRLALASAELALVQEAARGKDEVALLELAWEACGSYRTSRTCATSSYHVEPLTSARALSEFAARNPSLHGSRKLARVLPHLADGSASARETKLGLVFGLPVARGGEEVGVPRMNYEVVASRAARAISGRRSFRCDLCWPEAKLDVEYQSREHHQGEDSRVRDSRRANALAAMGWMVIGVTNDELDSLAATTAIAEAIRRRLGKRLQTRVADHHARRLRLRRQLGLPIGYD